MLRVSHFSPRVSRYSRPHRRDLTGWARIRPRRKNSSPTIPELKKRVTYVTLFADVQWAKRFCFGGDWRNGEEKIPNEANRALDEEPGGFAGGFPAIFLGRFRIPSVWAAIPGGAKCSESRISRHGFTSATLRKKKGGAPRAPPLKHFHRPPPTKGSERWEKRENACYTAPTTFNASW